MTQPSAEVDKTPDLPRNQTSNWTGKSLMRREDKRLVTGRACFTDDLVLPDCLFASFIRSPLANARIASIDSSTADTDAEIVAVFTGRDVGSCGELTVSKMLRQMHAPPHPPLPKDRVSAVGQPVAMVLGKTARAARDAAERIKIDYEPFGQCALSSDFHQNSVGGEPGQVALADRWQQGDCHTAFNSAKRIVSVEISHPRLAAVSLESRAIAVDWDRAKQSLHVWLSTQTPHRARSELSSILSIAADKIKLTSPDIGGAFGAKASLYPEEILVVWAAHQLKRPVRWTAQRSEDFLSASHGRGTTSKGRLAVAADGRFLALEARIVCPVGHWMTTSAAVPAWNAARILPGPYVIDNVDIETKGVMTHTAPVGIYRGAGRPEAAALMERLVDKAGLALGLDPIEIRCRNVIAKAQMPYATPTGNRIDSGSYVQALEKVQGWLSQRGTIEEIQRRRHAGERVGLGISLFVEPSGQGWETARVELDEKGCVIAATGGSSQGHGRETALSQIVADALEISPRKVTIRHGDSTTCPSGVGALASRSTPIGASAMAKAAAQVKREAEIGHGRFPIVAEVTYSPLGESWGYGCYAALAQIDRETCQPNLEFLLALDDAGRLINPMLAEGQVHGGLAQGLGEALMEAIRYDASGQLLTGSLMDYALPRASDMPPLDLKTIETLSPFNLLGAKGIGEAGTIGAVSAILNAVNDALSPLKVEINRMPLTGAAIWEEIRSAGQRNGSV